MTLDLRIRALRKERGLTLAELACQIGVSAPHLSEVERGKKNLNNHLLVRLADALEVKPQDLISGDQERDELTELLTTASDLSDQDLERLLAFAKALQNSV
ncbi:helix-turn-helix domain-containing protein [Jannaschia sp. AI_61]|nr:helix-turn-helix transcriptional regulator [Jannaschia sp. AI_61]